MQGPPTGRLAAVTGATGFLGRHIVRALGDAGWRVRILSRRDPIHPSWQAVVPQVVVGDLADDGAVQRLCADADLVVHCAGLVKAPSRAAFDRVNVEGARRVALAARHAPRTILVSSLTAREPGLSHYSASKAAGETAAREILGSSLTIARPCAIYGPGDRELLPVFKAADRLPVLPLLSPDARVAMVHVEDAARDIVNLAAAPLGGRTVAICDGRPDGYGWLELMQAAAEACGRRPAYLPIPSGLVRAIGITNDFTALFGAVPMLTRAKARELLHRDWTVPPYERHTNALPPHYDLALGFAHTVAWYRSAKWMKQ